MIQLTSAWKMARWNDGADGTNGTDGKMATMVLMVLMVLTVQMELMALTETTETDGADGTNGSASPNTMLTSISSPAASLGCNAGGRVMMQGLDNGDGGGTAQNGVLESGEVDYTTTYCSKYVIWQVADINSGLAAVTPEITWRYSSVIRSTSVRMMEAAARTVGS